MTTRISLREEAKLVLAAAEQRLARAKQAVEDFELEHHGVVVSTELRSGLERQEHCLRIELDEATRYYQKSLADFEESKR